MDSVLILVALSVAFLNGANDNIKGFAAAWGSGLVSYKRAVTFAALATFVGCAISAATGQALIATFSGRGLVSSATPGTPGFLAAAAGGAALTLLVATRLGFPVSTTHALLGGLMGAGIAAEGVVRPVPLFALFLAPLLLTPLFSMGLAFGATRFGVVGRSGSTRLSILSACCICAARAVNDTPKVVALLAATSLSGARGAALVTFAMVAGGLLFSVRVGQTMGRGVVALDPGLGTTANFVAASLVLAASALGAPVSTTHVTVGAIAGAGAQARAIHAGALRDVVLSWAATLPLAAVLSMFAMGGWRAFS